MNKKIFKTVLYFLCLLLPCLFPYAINADTTREPEIVKINGVHTYKLPADQLIIKSKENGLVSTKSSVSDGCVEYVLPESNLLNELLRLYNRAISKHIGQAVVLEESQKGENSIIESLQVNVYRELITGVKFFLPRGQN